MFGSKSIRTSLVLGLAVLVSALLANDGYKLRYHLDEGTVLKYRGTNKMDQTIEAMGSETTTESEATTLVQISGQKPEKPGQLSYIMEIQSLKVKVFNPMMDTTLVDPPELLNRRVRKVITETGDQIASIQLDTVKLGNPMMAQFFNANTEFLPNVPGEEIAVGGSVTISDADTIEAMGGKNTIQAEVTYTAVGKETVAGYDCLKLSYTGTVAITGEGSFQGMMKFFLEGDGQMDGTLYFAPKEGLMVSNETELEFDMTAAFTGQQNMTVPISQVTTSTLKLVK